MQAEQFLAKSLFAVLRKKRNKVTVSQNKQLQTHTGMAGSPSEKVHAQGLRGLRFKPLPWQHPVVKVYI